MTLLDTWIVVTPSAWAAIASDDYAYNTGRTGFWKSAPNGREVYNVIGTHEQITGILTALEAAEPGSVSATYAWTQGLGLDSLDPWPTDPAAILALMKDHVTYDEHGEIVSTTPATVEAPNWGHVFLGQSERVFAGEFSQDFGEEFF